MLCNSKKQKHSNKKKNVEKLLNQNLTLGMNVNSLEAKH